MKDDRIFAIKVNKDRVVPEVPESNEVSTKVVSKAEPEKVEAKKAKPEKVEAEKAKPEKVEPKKAKPDGSGDDGYVTEFGTFYSIEELDSFFKEQVRKWRELQGRQKDDYSELYDLFEGEKKKNGSLKASLEDLKKENIKLEGDMEVAKKQYAEGVFIGDLIKDAGEIAKSSADIFEADIKLARKQRDDAMIDAQSEYDKVKEAYKTAEKALDAAEKLKEKKQKEAISKFYKKIEAASDEFIGRFAEEFEKKKDERVQEARERIIEREDIAEEKAAIEIAEKFAEENDRSIRKRKEKLAERERRAK